MHLRHVHNVLVNCVHHQFDSEEGTFVCNVYVYCKIIGDRNMLFRS